MTPEQSTALVVAGLMPAVFGTFLPPVATVRAEADTEGHQAASLRQAVLAGAVVIAGAGVVTRSRPVILLGAVCLAGQALAYAYAVPRGT